MLSVIIPVFRVEQTLDRCVLSVVAQTFTDMEIILVDDGSPDRCPALCDEWAGRDARIRVVHKANGGLSDARNAGLDVAQGSMVTFVDSDDYLDSSTYEQAVPLAASHDLVEFPFCRHTPTHELMYSLEPTVYAQASDYWLGSHAYEHAYTWNKIYRRSLFDSVRFPKGKVFEDAWTLPLLLRQARSIATTGHGLYHYCMNAGGITQTATGRELNMLLEAHLQVLPQWADDRYYMHMLNIQLDVCRLTGQPPALPLRRVNPLAAGLSARQRLKALTLDTIGIKGLCKIHQIANRSHS